MPEGIDMNSTERVELTGRPFSKNDCAEDARSASAKPAPEGWEMHGKFRKREKPLQNCAPGHQVYVARMISQVRGSISVKFGAG